jgi:hypothetical protein
MPRQNTSHSLARELELYYGGKRCVVTKSDQCEYHHLDDNDSNTTFVNLVPLASTLNCPTLRDACKRKRKSLPVTLCAELEPDNLLQRGNLHFAEWNISLAYGCARLAFYIGMNYLDMDAESRLPFSCAAMYFARHSANHALIKDILERDFFPIINSQQLSEKMRYIIIQELAGIYSEHGHHKESLSLYQMIPKVLISVSSEINAKKYSAVLRRKATSIIADHGATAIAKALLSDARDACPFSKNLEVSIANTLAWSCLSENDYKGAIDILKPLHDQYNTAIFSPSDIIKPISITAWNAAEVFHSYSIAASHLGKNYKRSAEKALHHASLIYTKTGAFPFVLRPRFWDQAKHVHMQASQRGVNPIRFMSQLPSEIVQLIENMTKFLIG